MMHGGNMKTKMTPKQLLRGLLYLSGMLVTGLGVNVLLRSALGAGAWDTVNYNMRSFLNVIFNIQVTLGTVSFVVYAIVLGIVFGYHKQLKFLLVLVPIFGIALSIDFWDIVVIGNVYPEALWIRLILFGLGIIFLTLGLSLIITTQFPAMVFDELTLIVMKVLKLKSFFTARILIELFAIVLASILGFIGQIGFGSVNFGSFILALIIGPMIEMHLKYLTPLIKKIIA